MLLFLIIALLACWLVYTSPWFQIKGLSSKKVLGAFALKCLMGFALLWMYGQYLDIDRADADVYKYFDDAVILQSSNQESTGLYWSLFAGEELDEGRPFFQAMYNWDKPVNYLHINDNRTVIRLHSLLLFISHGDIRVHQIFFSLLSFLGLIFLFKGMRRLADVPAWTFILICILPPSLLFWGSGLLKETLVMLPLGLTVYGLAHIGDDKASAWAIVIGVIGFYFVKPYVGLCLLPAILFLLLTKENFVKPVLSFFIVIAVLLLSIVVLDKLSPVDLISSLAVRQMEFQHFAQSVEAGSMIELQSFSDLPSFIKQGPEAITNCLFRPMIWEARTPLEGLSALENLAYIFGLVLVLMYRRKDLNLRSILFSLLFVLSLALLIGSVTPVLGAIVRYKVPLLPFLIFAMVQFVDLNRIPFLRTRITS